MYGLGAVLPGRQTVWGCWARYSADRANGNGVWDASFTDVSNGRQWKGMTEIVYREFLLRLICNTVPHSGHNMYRTVVTICTAHWSLYVPNSGHYMYRTVVTICTVEWSLYVPQWSLYVPYSGHYMYRTVVTICTAQWSLYVPYSLTFSNCTFCPHSCIYVFCVDLRTNSDYFPIQH